MNLKRGFGPGIAIWSRGSTSQQYFFAATPGMDSARIKSVIAALFLDNTTGPIFVQLAFQESDDGETWPDQTVRTPVTFSTNDEGATYDNTWRDVMLTRKYARFGFAVKNDTENGTREFACCALRIDTRGE